MANEAEQDAARQGRAILVMGVSGSGKTTIGQLVAQSLKCPFLDADDYHSPHNIEKMSQGVPLTDEDRQGWLRALTTATALHIDTGFVLACSGLKKVYRQRLLTGHARPTLVFLKISSSLAQERVSRRVGHFFPAHLVSSQFTALEEPADDEVAIIVEESGSPAEKVDFILSQLS